MAKALVVRGGWEGHTPVAATDLFIPHLEQHGYDVHISDTPDIYADAAFMAGVDLIMQCYTMGTIDPDALRGLGAAIRSRHRHGRLARRHRRLVPQQLRLPAPDRRAVRLPPGQGPVAAR